MNINFLLIESSRPQWSETAFESYKSKFNKSITISWNGIKPATRNKNYRVAEVVQKESALLKKKIKEHDFVVALDKEGVNFDIAQIQMNYQKLFFKSGWIADLEIPHEKMKLFLNQNKSLFVELIEKLCDKINSKINS